MCAAFRRLTVLFGVFDDCMDAGSTSPWMDEVDRAGSWRSRATPGAVAEGEGWGRGCTADACVRVHA